MPRGLYVDQAGIYRSDREPTAEELACDKQPETQFGRAMRELEVELILARSPQAKGRVERVNGTLQDRLVKALRRAGSASLATANAFLETTFLPEFNARFGKPAADPGDAHRPLTAAIDLDRILAVREPRTVQHDWTVRWQNRFLQLPAESAEYRSAWPEGRSLSAVRWAIADLLGRPRVGLVEAERDTSRLPSRPPRSGPTGSSQGHRPAAHHPWRGRRTIGGRTSFLSIAAAR